MMTIDIVASRRTSPRPACSVLTHPRSRTMKINSMRLAAPLVAALSSLMAGSPPALASAPPIHDQAPGFFRLKVGDLEVTALYDAAAVFALPWLKGKKAKIDGVAKALNQDPHLLDAADLGFLVNTGKQLILVDAGAGTWYGGGTNERRAGSAPTARCPRAQMQRRLVPGHPSR